MISENDTPQDVLDPSPYGFRIEYPTLEEVHRFERELSWEERFEVLSQGFHRGCYVEQCYSMGELTRQVVKRNPRNPTGGVHSLDGEKLVKWVGDVVGDRDLAAVIERIFKAGEPMSAMVDTVRAVLTSRMNQYAEVLGEAEAL